MLCKLLNNYLNHSYVSDLMSMYNGTFLPVTLSLRRHVVLCNHELRNDKISTLGGGSSVFFSTGEQNPGNGP